MSKTTTLTNAEHKMLTEFAEGAMGILRSGANAKYSDEDSRANCRKRLLVAEKILAKLANAK